MIAGKEEDNEFHFRCIELEIVEYQCEKLILWPSGIVPEVIH